MSLNAVTHSLWNLPLRVWSK